eukprot:g81648.t1
MTLSRRKQYTNTRIVFPAPQETNTLFKSEKRVHQGSHGPTGKSRQFSGNCLFKWNLVQNFHNLFNLENQRAKSPLTRSAFNPTAKAWDADKVLSNRTEQKASPTGKPPPQKKSATSETKSAGKAPGSKKGSKKGAKKAASKVAAKSRARKLTYTPERQDDAPAAEEVASAAEAKAEEAKAAATAAAAKDGSTGETGGFVHDQQEKGGARSQDEVLKDLADLSKISSAAKAGLLGADTVLRLDDETPEGLKPLGPTLNGKEDDVRVIDVTLHQGEPDAAAKEGNNDPPMPGSLVSTQAQALRKSNLTFIIKPTTQYYYKFAPSASPEEQRDKMKALVIAYTVHNGPDEADAEAAYFAWLPEGQYWSNLGLDLVVRKAGATVPEVEGKVIDDLRFCEEEDIDPVATKKYWDDHPGGPTKELLKKAVDVLVEPHIHFANGTWPASAPLPGIPRNLAPSPERSVAASTPTGAKSAKDTDDGGCAGNRKHREQKGPSPPTLRKAKYGEICLHEGDILDGTGKVPLLRFFSDCIDPVLDPVEYAKAISAPGDNTMQLGGKLWRVSETIHDQCAIGTLPPSDAGGLVNHAPEGKGANGVWILRKSDKFPVGQCTDNLLYGSVLLWDYEGKDNGSCTYWADHPDGLVQYNLPVRVDSDGNFIWREIGALSPKISPGQGNKKKPGTKKGAKKSASKKQSTKKGGNQHHRPGCNCVTCPRMRANQEKNDGDNEESPHLSPHQSPLKTPPFRVGGGDRTPPKGNGGRKEPEEEKVNRKHGAGCQCQECVPPAKHGEGCMCPTCDPPHGKGCMCERWQCQQAAAAAGIQPPGRKANSGVGGNQNNHGAPSERVFHGKGCMCPDCSSWAGLSVHAVPKAQRNRNSGVGGQWNDNHWHGGGGGGGNGGGGRNNGMYDDYGGQQLSGIWQPHIRSSRQAHFWRRRSSRALLSSTTLPPAWISGTGGGMASGAVARSPERTYCPGSLVLLFLFVFIAFLCGFCCRRIMI